MSVDDAGQRSDAQGLTAAISSAIVSLMREYTGRGPTRARTTIRDDLIVVLLENTLTKGECALVRKGRTEKVIEIRREFQDAMREDCVARIQELTGRRARAMMSTNHIDPDLAVELFMLEEAS